MLKFHLITDTHYYNYDALGHVEDFDQTTTNESGAVLDAIFDWLLAHNDTDIVLIAGDLCDNSLRVQPEGLIPKLRRLQEGGKRVFLLSASHDYCGFKRADAKNPREDAYYRDELYDLYYEFGNSSAISRYEADPFSYVVQLAPGYRLICINGDVERDSDGKNYAWALEEIAKAKAEGQFIFAMHHYPMLPPSPIYPILAPSDMFRSGNGLLERMADAGLRFLFTGHTHMQNINFLDSPAGNRLYEINTGAAVGCGAPIRTVTIGEETMEITTSSIDHFEWDLQGKSAQQYLNDHFDRMLNNIFEAANTDVVKMLDIIDAEFRINKESLLKHQFLLERGGKFLYRLTFGKAGTLLCCRSKIDASVRSLRVKDFFVEIVRNMYNGDEPYSMETPVGAAVYALTGRLDSLLKRFLKKELPFGSLQSLTMQVIYDGGLPDNNAVLPLK